MVTTKSRMSMKRIREELGFRPRFTFREAIEALRPLYAGGPSAPPEK
jgi:nucleoside-diphosphate-sugar epimerase